MFAALPDDPVESTVSLSIHGILGRTSPAALRYVHYGATSQDALDTGLVLQLPAAIHTIEIALDAIVAALIVIPETPRNTLLVAPPWLQHPLPTTFGCITAG